MKIYKAPEAVTYDASMTYIFLAGSIEQGEAYDWQAELTKYLENCPAADHLAVLNPRREKWEPEAKQSISNPYFREQVTWELVGIEEIADILVFNFEEGTKSPITLAELGLVAGISSRKYDEWGKRVFVSCPLGFWRRGNVEVMCERYGFRLFESFNELRDALLAYL